MIGIIDYQAGNVPSVKKALDFLGATYIVTEDPIQARTLDKLILPGVGNFAATKRLNDTGLTEAVRERIVQGIPFLGICVGLQWLFESSEEAPNLPGLGLLKGVVAKFPETVKSPHVGWNLVEPQNGSKLFRNLNSGGFVYYTHSYRCPITPEAIATTEYGGSFAAAVERGNIFGVQFHPEKSGEIGLRVLKNFLEI
ncbi:MAG TPA: imidazole glycerol phosphate synthase subunit HisH [Candidatus Saccharimonadales bacterium]|jgi:glutamine amidotransferase|nr:imidazole glycerol phosphate synthase subunit HisH [Candidatus Saccharimonadales bacterium]